MYLINMYNWFLGTATATDLMHIKISAELSQMDLYTPPLTTLDLLETGVMEPRTLT